MIGLFNSLFQIYLITLMIVIPVQVGKDIVADRKIKKQGYKITYNGSIFENIIDFIKDYGYIFVPVMNLKMAYNILLMQNKNYIKYRIKKLTKRNKLIKEEKVEPKKEEKTEKKQEIKKTETKKETEKVLTKQEQLKHKIQPTKQEVKKPEVIQIKEDKKTELIKPFVEEIKNSNDINFLEALKKEYRGKSIKLRQQYQKLLEEYQISKNPETKKQLNSIASNINIYDNIFICAKDRISELKKQINKKQMK